MKLACVLLIFALSAVLAFPRDEEFKILEDPKIRFRGGGNPGEGVGVSGDIRKNVWESDNKRHSFDVTVGGSQQLGGPYSGAGDRRGGGIYTYRW